MFSAENSTGMQIQFFSKFGRISTYCFVGVGDQREGEGCKRISFICTTFILSEGTGLKELSWYLEHYAALRKPEVGHCALDLLRSQTQKQSIC